MKNNRRRIWNTVAGVGLSILQCMPTATALPVADEAAIVAAVQRNVPQESLRPDFVRLLRAIRRAENGRLGREFGVMDSRAHDLDSQAGFCAATVYKVWLRWDAGVQGVGVPYLVALRDQYAPIGAENDPTGLNENWLGNVVSFLENR